MVCCCNREHISREAASHCAEVIALSRARNCWRKLALALWSGVVITNECGA
jgi:hypothetical protein